MLHLNPNLLLASDLEDIIPGIIGFGLVVLVPLIAMLLSHQRKMAELMHRRPMEDSALLNKLDQIQSEVRELRGRLDQQTILLDDHTKALTTRLGADERKVSS